MDGGFLLIVGRLLIGGAFVVSGVRILMSLEALKGLLAAKRVPFPIFVATAGGVFEVVMGLVMIAGYRLGAVSVALAIFVVAATLMVHRFWEEEEPQRGTDINAVISNLIIVGALLALAGTAP